MPAPSSEILTTPSKGEVLRINHCDQFPQFISGIILSLANRVQELFEVYWTLLDPRSGMEVRAQKNSSRAIFIIRLTFHANGLS